MIEGMDVTGARVAFQAFTRELTALDELRRSLAALVEQVDWVGPDRDRFIGEFQGDLALHVGDAIQTLSSLSKTLDADISRQIQASNT